MRAFSMFVLVLTVTGCSRNTLDELDAAVAWDATAQELGRTPSSVLSLGTVLDGDIDLGCLDGGSLGGEGSWRLGADLSDISAATRFDYVLEFDGCEHDGVVIDGIIDFQGSASASLSDLSTDVAFNWRGLLDYSGDIDGTCVIKVDAEASADLGDGVFVGFEGKACGEDLISLQASLN